MVKEYFPWSDKYSVGVKLIDNDHQELFSVVNDLHALVENTSSPQEMRITTDQLIRYAQEHFEREEHLLSEYGYPELNEHRHKHYEFIRMVYAIRKIELERIDSLDPHRVLTFLEGWLRRHILKADMAFVPTLKSGYGRRKSDITTPLNVIQEKESDQKEELVTVPVQVPFSSVNTMRRCARLLRAGGKDARTIEEITDPISSMTLSEALQIADIVLCSDNHDRASS